MPDLRQTRKKIQIALLALVCVDIATVIVLLSPLVGSTESRRQELNQLWTELQQKTKQVQPLKNLDKKVIVANREIADFYKKRFPQQDSRIITQFGKLAAANNVTIEQARYRVDDTEIDRLHQVEVEATLSGNYIALAKFINALERDDTFFLISSIELGGDQKGPIRLQMKLQTYLQAAT
jgi:type IV pilus assembly protein PilO